MIDARILQRAIVVGTVLQAAMMLLAHLFPWIRVHVLLFGGMMISATAGYLYAMDFGAGFGRGILGGAIVGGVCGFFGVMMSVLLGDTPMALLALWTAIFTLTGIAGGFWGEVAARMTRMGK
jgi:hypothetical protein